MEWQQIDGLRASLNGGAPAGSFTLADYCAKYGIGRAVGKRELLNLVVAGKLSATKIPLSGHITNVYWIPDQPEAEPNSPKGKRK